MLKAKPLKGKIWDNQKYLGAIKKNESKTIFISRVSKDRFEGIDIREFYLSEDHKTFLPSTKGIVINNNNVEEFVKKLNEII